MMPCSNIPEGVSSMLTGGHQRHTSVPQREVNSHVVRTIPSETIDLVNDAVVHLMFGDVLDHPHHLGTIGHARRFARVHELFNHGRADLLGLPTVRISLGGDGVSLVRAALLRLLLRGDTQVGHGHGAARGHRWGPKAIDHYAVVSKYRHGSPP